MSHAILRLEPFLATKRLRLRPVDEADLDPIVAALNDFAVTRMLARVPFPYRRADADAFLTAVRQGAAAGTDLSLVIEQDGRLVGGIGLTGLAAQREFGYWLARAHWGMGLATEAGRAFLAYAFGDLGIDTVHSGVFLGNDASLRVQQKLGFERTGLRLVHCLARGVAVEHIDTVLTRARFQETTP
jgi:RimJ/RimL family protein N-acetyltransferase